MLGFYNYQKIFNHKNCLRTFLKRFETTVANNSTSQTGNVIDDNINVKDKTQKEIKTNNLPQDKNDKILKKPVTFARLFKESKFVSMGDLENKILIGRIVDVVGDDLYIDYGGKFNCVCKKPNYRPDLYVRNANVRIKLKSFEMASYFLNSAKHITLLESDAKLLGLFDRISNEKDDQRLSSIKKEVKLLNLEPKHY